MGVHEFMADSMAQVSSKKRSLLARAVRWRSRCPYCDGVFARSEYFHAGPRRCGGCGATIKPAEPWNTCGNVAFGVPIAFGVVAVAIVGLAVGIETVGRALVVLAMCGVVFALGIAAGWIVCPYITPFTPVPRTCGRCGYDRRGIGRAPCPECGTPPVADKLRETKLRAAPAPSLLRARANGSAGSPATAVSPPSARR